jgi:hypothetical protein
LEIITEDFPSSFSPPAFANPGASKVAIPASIRTAEAEDATKAVKAITAAVVVAAMTLIVD